MESNIIKRWSPIIAKLDSSNSLTEDQKISLYNYCNDFSIATSKPMLSGSSGIGDLQSKLLSILLKIIFEVMINLAKENINISFSNEAEPEPEMIFENNSVRFISKSNFETKYSFIDILDNTVTTLNDFGLDAYLLSEKALIQQTILNLVELGKQNGELCIHVTGNSLQLISEPELKKRMVLTYKVKNIQK